jgi:RNA polymerase sigma-70 factor (ECF subfamily)
MAFSRPIANVGRGACLRPTLARWLDVIRTLMQNQHALEQEGAAGDASAYADNFDHLFQYHETRIFGYLWRMTNDRQLASDLCQETFLRAWQHIQTLSAYREPLGWLYRVATNLALNARRGRLRLLSMVEPLDDADGLTGPDSTGNLANDALVHDILQQLSPRARAALVLREVYGLSVDEVAQTVGATPVATKKMLSRAREQFRVAYLREDGEHE